MCGDDEAYAVPKGVPERFITRFAPADYMEAVNTNGLPYYAKQEAGKFGKAVELEAQSNPLHLCTRPRAVIKLSASTGNAASYRDEWESRGEVVRTAFANFDIELVDVEACEEFLTSNWGDKLSTQRAMKAWLQSFFSWAVLKKHIEINSVREIKVKKPKVRKVYIRREHFVAIRDALAVAADGKKTRTGPTMQVFVDLCYLKCQRSTEIRNLRWADIDAKRKLIRFVPSKTEDSSGEAVDWPRDRGSAKAGQEDRAADRRRAHRSSHDRELHQAARRAGFKRPSYAASGLKFLSNMTHPTCRKAAWLRA